jgi:hypothetical protein
MTLHFLGEVLPEGIGCGILCGFTGCTVTLIADASFGAVLCQFWLVLGLVGVPGALGGSKNSFAPSMEAR